MVSESSKILYFPFDEPSGSTKAYDYSKTRADGTVSDGTFQLGRSGNCLHFSGLGYCEVSPLTQVIPLTGDFTIMAWLRGNKSDVETDTNPSILGIMLNFDGDLTVYTKNILLTPGNWYHIAIVKAGNIYKIYQNATLIDTYVKNSTYGNLLGIALYQDYYGSDSDTVDVYGKGDVDQFVAYSVALSSSEIYTLVFATREINYFINGVNIKNYGVYVSGSKGIIDGLKMKEPLKVEWDDYHGEVIDLSAPRYEPREITLDCFVKASGKNDFVARINGFLDLLRKSGTQRLSIDIHPSRPLVYEVYLKDNIQIQKRWNDDIMVGTFSVTVREPEPVKKVLRHIRTGESNKTASITLSSTKLLNIYWGDSTKTLDVSGTSQTITHTYTADGEYDIIIAGNIEDITAFTTGSIIVWNKL